jgi:hypothetical protein
MIENLKLKVFRIVADTPNHSRAADELHLVTDCRARLSHHLRRGCLLAVQIRPGFETRLRMHLALGWRYQSIATECD